MYTKLEDDCIISNLIYMTFQCRHLIKLEIMNYELWNIQYKFSIISNTQIKNNLILH